jgi:hypothetical protein
MIPIELEERLIQAVTIIEKLLVNPTPELLSIAKGFVEENKQDD